MKRVLPTLAVAVLAALTLLSGVIQGRLSNRWGISRDAREAMAMLEQIPTQFGGWRREQPQELSETVSNTLQCEGYLLNQYVHESGALVTFAVLLGPPGPIAVHTPEICYSSREYNLVGERTRVRVEEAGSEGHFWRTKFQARDLDARTLHTYYAWSDGGAWNASESPRFEYAGRPYLFKLQLAGYPETESESNTDPCEQFLNAFVPVWHKATSSLGSNP